MKERRNQPEQGVTPELTPAALHETLSKTLLGPHARYWGDAHYYHGAADYISETGEPTTTAYRVNDYHAADSESWVFRFAVPYGSDLEEQKRLLEEGHAIVGIQTEAPTTEEITTYSVFIPQEVKPDSVTGYTMHRDPGFPEIPPSMVRPEGWPELPTEWPVEGPVVAQLERHEHRIIDPATNPFLQAVYRDLHESA